MVVPTLIESWLLEAVLAEIDGNRARAHAAVKAALRLAGPRDIARPFVETGRPVRELLVAGVGRYGHEDPFATRVLAVIPPDSADTTFSQKPSVALLAADGIVTC